MGVVSRALRQPVPDSICGGFCPVGSDDLVEDMRDVGSDGPEADAELLADLTVSPPSSDKPEHRPLSFRQMTGIFGRFLWTKLELLLQGDDPLLKRTHTEFAGNVQRFVQQRHGFLSI